MYSSGVSDVFRHPHFTVKKSDIGCSQHIGQSGRLNSMMPLSFVTSLVIHFSPGCETSRLKGNWSVNLRKPDTLPFSSTGSISRIGYAVRKLDALPLCPCNRECENQIQHAWSGSLQRKCHRHLSKHRHGEEL